MRPPAGGRQYIYRLSLINLQVGIGGQNILNSTLSMTYENFLEQVNLAEQLTSSDFGVSTEVRDIFHAGS